MIPRKLVSETNTTSSIEPKLILALILRLNQLLSKSSDSSVDSGLHGSADTNNDYASVYVCCGLLNRLLAWLSNQCKICSHMTPFQKKWSLPLYKLASSACPIIEHLISGYTITNELARWMGIKNLSTIVRSLHSSQDEVDDDFVCHTFVGPGPINMGPDNSRWTRPANLLLRQKFTCNRGLLQW